MKSLVAAIMALTAVFAFTSTTAASAASKEDEMMQRIMERELAEEEAMQLEAIKQAMIEAIKQAMEEELEKREDPLKDKA